MGPDVTGRVLNLVHQADIALAEGKPGDAIRLVEEALERYPALDKPVYICHGIAIGLRAAADLARSARMKQDAAALEGAVEEGERLHQAMMEKVGLPGPKDGWRLEVGCLAAQCDAELSRLHGKPDPEGWDLARDRWLALSMPYRAAYCRFRWAEDSLNAGVDRSEVARALEELSAFLHVLDARLLLDEVRALARRARIDLGDRYSADRYGLTERERDVLAELATGATNRQIAETLFISEKTASVHVSNILRKLDAANRGEAAAAAIREGLVDLTRL
jgi:DNA-binding CsgD family transcriptional regulator